MEKNDLRKHNYRKKFNEYFKEFVMLFLAVTLGFFAERFREHINQVNDANEFLQSYYNELQQQQFQIKNYTKIFETKIVDCDSLINIYYNHEENKKLYAIRTLIIPAKKIIDLSLITSAYNQMVNSGTLRYVKNAPLREKMAYYNFHIEDIKNFNNHLIEALFNMAPDVGKLEDLHDMVTVSDAHAFNYNHVPNMDSFAIMSNEQRRLLINYYVGYKIQAVSNLGALQELFSENSSLINMVNKQLNK